MSSPCSYYGQPTGGAHAEACALLRQSSVAPQRQRLQQQPRRKGPLPCGHALLLGSVFSVILVQPFPVQLQLTSGGSDKLRNFNFVLPRRFGSARKVGGTALQADATSGDVSGKFYQLEGRQANPDVVKGGYGPLGVIVAGWSDDDLEYVVAPALSNTWQAALSSLSGGGSSPALSPEDDEASVPIRVLSQEDLSAPLEDILETISFMDSVMPEIGQDAKVERPFLLFSGWPPALMMKAVRQFRNMVALRRLQDEPMMAMVVPRALRKPMSQLVEEIEGDFKLNRK
mmetsp:Transcript_13407/g.31493  ORF Transcript_13407/g.31493 Transcript_13407/m.31493 type:complete len:286 (+) Transcript_13407:56-913(+)